MVKRFSVVVIVLVVLQSCSAGLPDMAPQDYLTWYKNNTELTQMKKYEEAEFSVTYKTPELIYLMEGGTQQCDRKSFNKRKEELGDLLYFNFKIKTNQNSDLFAYAGGSNFEYPMEYMQNDFYLVQENDTFHCALFHFERNYGLNPINNISTAFTSKGLDRTKDFTLIYNDELFKTGINKFKFYAGDVNAVPQLRLNEYEK